MPDTADTHVDWRSLSLVVMSGVVTALNVGKIAPALPELMEQLALSLTAAGWLIGSISATALMLGLLMGRLVDRFGARRMLLQGLCLSGLGSVLGAFAPHWLWLLQTRLLEGLGILCVVVAAPTLLHQRLPPQQRARVMGWWGSFMPMGTALSILLAPLLLPVAGWRGLWGLIALLSFAMAAVLAAKLQPTEAPAKQGSPAEPQASALGSVLRAPSLYLIGACFGLYAFQYTVTLQFLPLWLGEQRGVALLFASLIAAAFCLCNILGNLLGGRLMAVGYRPQTLMLLCSLLMGGLAVPVYHPDLADAWRGVALIALPVCGGVIPPCAFALVPRVSPSPRLVATSNGLVVQMLNAGMMFGAPLLAAVVSVHGWGAAPWVLGSAALLSASCAGLLQWRLGGA